MITDTILNFNDPSKTGLILVLTVFKKTSDNSNVTPPAISELDSGFYKFSFDIDSVDSDIYFVATDGSNTLTGVVSIADNSNVQVQLDRILGLTKENQAIDANVYDGNGNLTSSRLRTYTDSASVGTASNVLATYVMTATYTGNQLDTFEVVKS